MTATAPRIIKFLLLIDEFLKKVEFRSKKSEFSKKDYHESTKLKKHEIKDIRQDLQDDLDFYSRSQDCLTFPRRGSSRFVNLELGRRP